ncbi:MAG: hypothetical protein KatS3mg102_1752 [Planctomycetota bacterium]|nr:MAG: hypothetical protein KatS3mg102_1752 [Planctomycetota bacterium]
MIRVADNGAGMDPTTLERIFDPFFTTKPAGVGTGLGLTNVYAAVRQAGGAIRVQSAPGEGTVFTLHLPVAPETSADAAPPHSGRSEPERAAAPPPGPLGTGEQGGASVIVAEDDEALRAVMAHALRQRGYRVLPAGSVEQLVQLAAEQPPGGVRLLVTDSALAGTGAPELLARLRARHPALRVLMVSGAGAPLAAAQPGVALLAKPFSPEQLAAAARALLTGPGGGGATLASGAPRG